MAWWAAVIALGAFTWWSLGAVVDDAASERARWGPSRPVAVATRPIRAGAPITRADVRLATLPRAAVPGSALHRLPIGGTTTTAIGAGEVIVAARVGRRPGPGGRLRPGQRAIAVPLDPAHVPLRDGDLVDLLGTGPAADVPGGGEAGGGVAARAAEVLTVDDERVVVAVTPAEASRVAGALGSGALVAALVGSRP